MEQAFGRIISIFVAVLMFFLVPLMINMQRQESVIQLAVMQDTVQFVDSVRNMGVLTEEMYEEYQNKIRKVKDGLEVTVVHYVNSIHIGESGIEQIQKIHTHDEIIETWEKELPYTFQKGDFFRVEVKQTVPGIVERFLGSLSTGEGVQSSSYVYYGGSVRYEVK